MLFVLLELNLLWVLSIVLCLSALNSIIVRDVYKKDMTVILNRKCNIPEPVSFAAKYALIYRIPKQMCTYDLLDWITDLC